MRRDIGIFTDQEAATLFEAQGILRQHIDAADLDGDEVYAEPAEAALRMLVNRDADRACGKEPRDA